MNIPNLSIERRHCCGLDPEEKLSYEEFDAQRDHTGIICACREKLTLLVPYDSGVCYQAVDLEKLVELMFEYVDYPANSAEHVIEQIRRKAKQTGADQE